VLALIPQRLSHELNDVSLDGFVNIHGRSTRRTQCLGLHALVVYTPCSKKAKPPNFGSKLVKS